MNEILIRTAAVALYWRQRWGDSNPEVGMGPSVETMAREVLEQADVEYTSIDLHRILHELKKVRA